MFNFNIKTLGADLTVDLKAGSSAVFLGANGSGKTRLGVYIEVALGERSHRVAAQRSLELNTNVQVPSYEVAERNLFYGNADYHQIGHRNAFRWGQKLATKPLSDYGHVLAALFAEENRVAVEYRQKRIEDASAEPPRTKLDRLRTAWNELLPHRTLTVLDGTLKVRAQDEGLPADEESYDASELSDGERVIFYLFGQVLLARANSVMLIDEPELHVNRSIIGKMWDIAEGIRPDCAFIYLTHDVDFTVSRRSSTRFAVKRFIKKGGVERWDVDIIPENDDIPDEVVTVIAGSRQPILFVEGDLGSLDASIYRRVFDQYAIRPVGSCDAVIKAVTSLNSLPRLQTHSQPEGEHGREGYA